MKTIIALCCWAAAAAAYAGSGYNERERTCITQLIDHLVIANARLAGRSAQELREGSTHEEPRRSEVMALIDEAYAAQDVREWFQQQYWYPCVRGESKVKSQDMQHERHRMCAATADFAVSLWRDIHELGIPKVNVMPRDEPILEYVRAFRGSKEELHRAVINACMGASA